MGALVGGGGHDLDLEEIMDRVGGEGQEAAPVAFAQAEEPRAERARRDGFRDDLQKLINQHSKENGSDTPDLFLADFLVACLAAFDAVTKARDAWYGEGHQLDKGKV